MAKGPNGEIASDVSNDVVCRRISKISEASTLPPEIYETISRSTPTKQLNPDDKITVVWCVDEGAEKSNMEPTSAAAHHADRKRRRKVAMAACMILLLFGGVHIAQATMAFKMVTNVNAGAFWATAVLVFGGLISLLGVYNKKEGLEWMSRGLTLILVGIVLALIGAIIDGVTAAAISEIDFRKCTYTDTGKTDCNSGGISCNTTTLSHVNSCFCCYIASHRSDECSFKSVGLAKMPSHFGGVTSCRQVSFMYLNLLWSSVAFSTISAIFAIVVAAVVGAYKKMVSTAAVVYTTSSPVPSGTISTTYAFPTSASTTTLPKSASTSTMNPPARPPPPNVAGPSTSYPVYAPVVSEVIVPQREEKLGVAPTRSRPYPVQQVIYPAPPPRPIAPPTHVSSAPPAYHT